MGFSHPGNPIRGPLVAAGDVVRVDAVKPPPVPYTGYCYPHELGEEVEPGVVLSGTVTDGADEREDRIMMALAFDMEIPPP
jgi:hypothetical protein